MRVFILSCLYTAPNMTPIPEYEALRQELANCHKTIDLLTGELNECREDLCQCDISQKDNNLDLQANRMKLASEISDRRRADEAQRESERKFFEIVRNIPGTVFQMRILPGGHNKFTYLSPKAEALFGIPVNFEEPGWDIINYIHADDRQGFIVSLARATLTGSWNFEGRLIQLDGLLKWFNGLATTSVSGEDTIIDGLMLDITEPKRLEDARNFLIKSEWTLSGEYFFSALARYLANALEMDYVCIDRLAGDGLSAETLSIFFDGKFEDNQVYTLADTPCGVVLDRSVCCYRQNVRHLFPHDKALQDMVAESYAGTTLWNSKGKPIGLIAVISRKPMNNPQLAESLLKLVGPRAGAELEYRENSEKLEMNLVKFKALFETFPLGVFITDEAGKILEANAAACNLVGLTQNEAAGLDITGEEWTIIRPDRTPMPPEEFPSVIALKNKCRVENVEMGVVKDGCVITWLQVTAAPVPLAGYGVVITISDITERKKTEFELKRLQGILSR